jgi:fluoride exporter
MPPITELLLVAGGGAVGSVVRYALALASLRLPGGATLAGTFAANVIGCFAIGLLAALVANHPDWLAPRTVIGLRVGMLGGLTTFSTFAAESVMLADQSRFGWMLLYVVATVLFGLIAVYAGSWTVASSQESS